MATLLARLSPGANYEDGSDASPDQGTPTASTDAYNVIAVLTEALSGTIEYIQITVRGQWVTSEQAGIFSDDAIRYTVNGGSNHDVSVTAYPANSSYATRQTGQITTNPDTGVAWTVADVLSLVIGMAATFNQEIPGNTASGYLTEAYVDVYGSEAVSPSYATSYNYLHVYHWGWFSNYLN